MRARRTPIPWLFLAALALAGPVAAQRPIDRCIADQTFVAFRSQLAGAVSARDPKLLLPLVADDIQFDFGGGQGRQDFAKAWALAEPQRSGLWEELAEVLRLGCAFDAGAATMPDLFGAAAITDASPFTTFLAVTPGSALRSAPDPAGPIVTRLEWDMLTLIGEAGPGDWLEVRLGDGRTGHVRREHVRSAFDYRAIFERRDRRWMMTSFLAGD